MAPCIQETRALTIVLLRIQVTAGREGGGRGAASTVLVFYLYAAQNNIMWADTIGLQTFHFKTMAALVWKRSPFRV